MSTTSTKFRENIRLQGCRSGSVRGQTSGRQFGREEPIFFQSPEEDTCYPKFTFAMLKMTMKTILITFACLWCAVVAFAQGNINFATRIPGPDPLSVPVYMPQRDDIAQELHGQGTNGIPPGTTAYTGGVIPATSGARFTAQLFGGPLGASDASLAPLTPTATFWTRTALAGFVVSPGAVVVPTVPIGSSARIQLRVWDNQGGQITSWADAVNFQAANSDYLLGDSLSFDSLPLNAPLQVVTDLYGLTSFNLHALVPEPSVIALGVLVVGALLLFRRRKN